MSPKKDEIAVHCCDLAISVFVTSVSKHFSRTISVVVYCLPSDSVNSPVVLSCFGDE